MDISSDLLNEFIVEAKAHIAEMEVGLLRMEEIQNDDDIINEVFRAAHSIKGTAGLFELNRIVELAHAIEALFGEFREHRLKPNSEMIDILLSAVDVLKDLVNSPSESEEYDISGHVANIKWFLEGVSHKPDDLPGELSAWDLWNQLSSSDDGEIEELESDPEPVCIIQSAVEKVNTGLLEAGHQPVCCESKPREVTKEESVRVSVELLNDLLNLAGEMVLRRNQLLRISDDNIQLPQLEVVAKGINELTTSLQKKIMKARMQPIANVFNKFPRIVRDLSRKVGKEVDLVILGKNVELDRSLVEALVDPMTHLIRNALDHGIETAEIRQLNKKPVTGALTLRAYHERGRVIVEVCDDGAGIDLEKVKTKAIERNLIGKADIGVMRDTDILNLIMSPGFSTAERVTDISGRGVGMDVVKTNIEKLGGKIEIVSELRMGTTFRLILPLTLAILSSFIVMAEGQSFAIPQANVQELLLIQPDDSGSKRVEMVHNHPVLRLRGRLLPLVRLGALLSQESGNKQKDDFFLDTSQTLRILVIKTGNSAYGLVVDYVYDTEEILVKPLSSLLSHCGLYSGSTVLGDGNIAMILDTERLALLAGLKLDDNMPHTPEVQGMRSVDAEKQYLLLFRCAGDEILGLDLAMVSRVEEVDVSRLQKIGSKYYFSFQGQTTRVIRPEHYLPISRKKHKPSKLYVILPKLVKHPVGILAEEIYDSVYTKVSLDTSGVVGKGILGSTLIDEKVVTLINIHELFSEAVPEYYHQQSGRNSDKSSNKTDNRKNTILLVEDTPFFLRVVKTYLENENFEVVTAENGQEALEKLSRHKVDLVISDIEMPIMTGIELVRAIRADNHLSHLPVIALTSLTGESNKEKGLRAGFDLYEFKLDRTRLLDSVNEALNKRA